MGQMVPDPKKARAGVEQEREQMFHVEQSLVPE
jgi:hypothetical protein